MSLGFGFFAHVAVFLSALVFLIMSIYLFNIKNRITSREVIQEKSDIERTSIILFFLSIFVVLITGYTLYNSYKSGK